MPKPYDGQSPHLPIPQMPRAVEAERLIHPDPSRDVGSAAVHGATAAHEAGVNSATAEIDRLVRVFAPYGGAYAVSEAYRAVYPQPVTTLRGVQNGVEGDWLLQRHLDPNRRLTRGEPLLDPRVTNYIAKQKRAATAQRLSVQAYHGPNEPGQRPTPAAAPASRVIRDASASMGQQGNHESRPRQWPVQLDDARLASYGLANAAISGQRGGRPSQHTGEASRPQQQSPHMERASRTAELTPLPSAPAEGTQQEQEPPVTRRHGRGDQYLDRVLQAEEQGAPRAPQRTERTPLNKHAARHTRRLAGFLNAAGDWLENPHGPAWLRLPDLHNIRYRMRNAYDDLSVRVYDATEAAAVRASRIWNVNLPGVRSWAGSYKPGENVLHGNFGHARQARRAQRSIDRENYARAADRFDLRVAMRNGMMDTMQVPNWRMVEPGNGQDTLDGTTFRTMARDIVDSLSHDDDHYQRTISRAQQIYPVPLESVIAHTLANQVFKSNATPEEFANAVDMMTSADLQHFKHTVGDAVGDTVNRLVAGIRYTQRADQRAAKARRRAR